MDGRTPHCDRRCPQTGGKLFTQVKPEVDCEAALFENGGIRSVFTSRAATI